MLHDRTYPHIEVRHNSPNHSSRLGARPTLIVVHATAGHNRPGVVDLQSLGEWFGETSSQVSSHVATDNEGNSARFVVDQLKAWHVAAYNRMALGIEQVMPGDGTELSEAMYHETARWIALFSKRWDIPIHKAKVSGGSVLKSGIIRHSELGALGGNHNDPGPYNLAHCLKLARGYKKRMTVK